MAGVLAKLVDRKRTCDMDSRHGESQVTANIPGGRQVRLCTACAKVLGYRVH